MVAYIDSLGDPILTGPQRGEISAWADRIVPKSVPLTMPRYPLLGLPEFGTVAALDHYVVRKRRKLGDFIELRAKTREQIDALMPELETLDRLIERPTAVNGKLSLDDIRVLPLLRSAAVVKGLTFPQKVRGAASVTSRCRRSSPEVSCSRREFPRDIRQSLDAKAPRQSASMFDLWPQLRQHCGGVKRQNASWPLPKKHTFAILGEGEKSKSAGCETRSRRGFGPA